PGVVFETGAGVLDEVDERFGAAGFDGAVVLQLFDVEHARRRALDRLPVGLSAIQRHEAELGLEQALVTALMDANHWVMAAVASRPLLTGFVGIDPVLLPPDRLDHHLRTMAALGARGVKLHPVTQGYRPDDPRMARLYDLCCELDLVVLSHSGPGHRGGGSARPSEFAAVLERWPRLRLVLAHLGGAAWREAADLAASFPGVLFDVSEIVAWAGAPRAPSTAQLAEAVRRIGADRIMLGSDFPWYDPAATADKVDALPGLGTAERAALLGGTATAQLGLAVGR
ncbi:MAG TPA: amidohydrolase family protein, partial [Acidimicrobiales bacterium]|nr:amidohydrolase family protein [Acidimicrobiales bacterium]